MTDLQQLLGQADGDDASRAAHARQVVGDHIGPHLEVVHYHCTQGRRRVEERAVHNHNVHLRINLSSRFPILRLWLTPSISAKPHSLDMAPECCAVCFMGSLCKLFGASIVHYVPQGGVHCMR